MAKELSVKTVLTVRDITEIIDFTSLAVGPVIGCGNFSSVFVGKYANQIVAVKRQERTRENPEKYLMQELGILTKLRQSPHPNIIKYFGAYDEVIKAGGPYALYIVLEFCQGGDLIQLILDDSRPMGWRFRINLAHQVASAILHMHKLCILHRDIKSANILLDSQWNCRLSDFGAARVVQDTTSPTRINSKKQAMTICGTDSYAAPEMLFQEEYTAAIDIFSLGMVIFELLKRTKVGTFGFLDRKAQNKFMIDVEGTVSQLPKDAPGSLVSLAQQCSLYEYDQRPTAQEVVDWLQDLHNNTPFDAIAAPLMRPVPEDFGNNVESTTTSNSALAKAILFKQDRQLPSLHTCGSVDAWLHKIGLTEYAPVMKEKGYKYKMLCTMGLNSEDFKYLGISNASHQSLLQRTINPSFSSTLRISVITHSTLGSVTTYLIASRYQFSCATMLFRFTDFVNFDGLLRRALKDEPKLLEDLPTFVRSQNFQKGYDFLVAQVELVDQRKKAFDDYLNLMAYHLKGTVYLQLLLEFLSLRSVAPMEKKGTKVLPVPAALGEEPPPRFTIFQQIIHSNSINNGSSNSNNKPDNNKPDINNKPDSGPSSFFGSPSLTSAAAFFGSSPPQQQHKHRWPNFGFSPSSSLRE